MRAAVLELGAGRPRPAPVVPSRKNLLYEQVILLVQRLIVERELEPGDRLPTHAELAELAGVSMITVRRALEELERSGQVRRHQGLGTFLARPRIVSEPSRAGDLRGTFSGDQDARRVGTTLLDVRRARPSVDLADALQIGVDDPVWQVSRLRHVDGAPMITETSTIPVSLAPGLDEILTAEVGSLYALLQSRYGLVDDYEEQYFDVISPTAEQRRLLHLPARAQVVRIRGLSVDSSGRPFDWFDQVYPAADFTFAFAGSAERRLVRGVDTRDFSATTAPALASTRATARRASRTR